MTIEDTLNSHEARLSRFDDAFQRVAVAIEQLTQIATRADERLDAQDSAQRTTDERLTALIDAHIGHESRQARLEESYQLLVQLASIQEERIDGHDEAQIHTDARLDALIDSQMQLTRDVNALNGRFERTDERLDRMAERVETHDQQFGRIEALQAENAEAIKALIAAQARTDEQIRLLVDRNGAK